MAQPLPRKLRIKEGMKLLVLHAPAGFERSLGSPRVEVVSSGMDYDQVHWFVTSRMEMEKEVTKVLGLLDGDTVCWIYYPKGTSGIQTDLTRDHGWERLLHHEDLQFLSLISFDETWSAFGMRRKTASDRKKEGPPKVRAVFDYVDASTKTIRLPEDLGEALKKSKKATTFFDSLSFTNRKEYVEWVVSAKREATRSERVQGTIERLEKGWKNPRNL